MERDRERESGYLKGKWVTMRGGERVRLRKELCFALMVAAVCAIDFSLRVD